MAERKSPAPDKKTHSKSEASRKRPTSAARSGRSRTPRHDGAHESANGQPQVSDTAALATPETVTQVEIPVAAASTSKVPVGTTVDQNRQETAKAEQTIPAQADKRLLDVFLIDSGWHGPVHAAVRANLPALSAYLEGHRFFVLSHEQSVAYIKAHPDLVGADPLLIVLDRQSLKHSKTFGFRLCLGHARHPDVAISMLKWSVQLAMTTNAKEMSTLITKKAHRETVQGAIELIGEGSSHLLEFAPL